MFFYFVVCLKSVYLILIFFLVFDILFLTSFSCTFFLSSCFALLSFFIPRLLLRSCYIFAILANSVFVFIVLVSVLSFSYFFDRSLSLVSFLFLFVSRFAYPCLSISFDIHFFQVLVLCIQSLAPIKTYTIPQIFLS